MSGSDGPYLRLASIVVDFILVLLWSGRTGSYLQIYRLSLRNNRLMFKSAGKLPIILEEFREYTPNE